MYVGSSMTIKLSSVDKELFYTVWAWKNNGIQDIKFVAKMGKYNDEDPDEIFQVVLLELGLKKIKLGVPIVDSYSSLLERTN